MGRAKEKDVLTISGIPLKQAYEPRDVEGLDCQRDLGNPGEYPFTRGVYPTMYRGQLWTMRQITALGTARETRERMRYMLDMGETGLSLVLDTPTLWGIDSDDPRAAGEVGQLGVALCSLQDMEMLFEEIPMENVSVSFNVAGSAPYIMAMYLALAQKKGIPLEKLNGTIQNDMLRETYSRGTWIILPTRPSLRLAVDIIEHCTKYVPKWNSITIAGYQTRESGSTAAQEIAFCLADAMAYVEACLARGMNVDDFAPRLAFYMSSNTYLFEEVAKFRAIRRMWARIVKERYGAREEKSCRFRFHTQCAANMLTAQQPYNNIARVTLQALAAILGGTQSLHTNAPDEAYATPTVENARTALRIQQVIAYESGAADTIDPLGGSYFIEALTNKLEAEAWDLIRNIESRGENMLEAVINSIESGFFAYQIRDSFYRYQREVQSGQRVVVGVNRFEVNEETTIPTLKYDPQWEELQRAKVERLKRERDNARVTACLERVRSQALTEENLLPTLIEAAEAYVTIGEVFGILREIFGEYRQPVIF